MGRRRRGTCDKGVPGRRRSVGHCAQRWGGCSHVRGATEQPQAVLSSDVPRGHGAKREVRGITRDRLHRHQRLPLLRGGTAPQRAVRGDREPRRGHVLRLCCVRPRAICGPPLRPPQRHSVPGLHRMPQVYLHQRLVRAGDRPARRPLPRVLRLRRGGVPVHLLPRVGAQRLECMLALHVFLHARALPRGRVQWHRDCRQCHLRAVSGGNVCAIKRLPLLLPLSGRHALRPGSGRVRALRDGRVRARGQRSLLRLRLLGVLRGGGLR
mmetsp:Transcript_7861/g.20175  ORF Transcript_7861/g.20175 Transcript_7861/m.20175 type:complete len:267 (+) Transcript_7861:3676-4476(+)